MIKKIFSGTAFFITKIKVSIQILTRLKNNLLGNIVHPCVALLICDAITTQKKMYFL